MNVNGILVSNYKTVAEKARECREDTYRKSYKEFSAWMHQCLKETPVPGETDGIFFGLKDAGEGFQLYITGTNAWHRRKTAWTKDSAYKNKFCKNLDILSELYLSGEDKVKIYFTAMRIISSYIKAYIKAYPASQLNRTKRAGENRKHLHIATGFAGGTMVKVR